MRWFSVSLIAFAIFMGPIAGNAATKGDPQKILNRAIPEPDTLDPHKMKLLAELVVLRDLFEGLTKSDAEGKIVGGIASHWDVSEDGTVYTFHLHEDLKWSDGHPLTAHDVVAGYRRLFDPATAAQAAAFLYTIRNGQEVNAGERPVEELGVSAPDDNTVIIHLKGPNPAFPGLIISGYTAPFPQHAFSEHGKDWAKPQNLISNGAYFLEEWVPHTKVRLAKNKHYREADEIKLENVLFHPITDAGTSVKQFRAGELDIVTGVPINQMEQLKEKYADALHISPDMATLYLVPNLTSEKLSDGRVRRALSLAVDRRIIADKVNRGMAIPAWSFTPPNVSNYDAPLDPLRERPMEARLAEARTLLAEAGYDDTNPLRLNLRTTESKDAKNNAIAIRAMWQKVGIKADIHTTEVKTHYADLSNGNFELAIASYYGWDDPFEFLSLFMAATTQVSFNYGRFDNPLYDAALNEALAKADIATRHAMMAEAETILLSDGAIIPIYYPVSRSLVAVNLKGYHDNKLNVHPSEYMSK